MNILILSVGTRNKIIQYFKKELNGLGQVMATDSSEIAPALYESDKYFIVPKINETNYLDVILDICKENNIKAVFSLIDPELTLIAENKKKFTEIGVIPVVSELELVKLCFDKFKMFEFMEKNNIPTVKSYIDKEKFYCDLDRSLITYPVFVKPINGSASNNINLVNSNEELDILFERFKNLMIQEYMNGIEYGADVYIDMLTGTTTAIFLKEKMAMRAGETDKSVSLLDNQLFNIIEEFVEKAGFRGMIDIDIFKVDDKYYISEVNPRFGGGYPHAYECGVNLPLMLINNLKGVSNPKSIGLYKPGIIMMKYNEVRIIQS